MFSASYQPEPVDLEPDNTPTDHDRKEIPYDPLLFY